MHFTDVSQLCSAIKNIEQVDLRRLVKSLGGDVSFGFPNVPYLEFYSDGPTSDAIEAVKVNGDGSITLSTHLYGDIDSSAAYPGHLSVLSQFIVRQTNEKN